MGDPVMAGGDVPEIVLESVDEPRRAFLRKLILGSAFVVPSVASFSMAGLSVGEASVLCANQTTSSIDCSGQNLHGLDLSNGSHFNVNFSGANLNGANLLGSKFFECEFNGANLNKANLTSVQFFECNLPGANLEGANLTNANFAPALFIFPGGNFANLTGANFQNTVGLTTVVWGDNTTCPDGTNSGANGDTCLGHLKPA
jgi:uncharacterized protein YjbI with pentapeptide repeats